MYSAPDFEPLFQSLTAKPPGHRPTLLCVCPNSSAVVDAATSIFAKENIPLFFVATLNQVDTDGGYTGWTPSQLAEYVDQKQRATGRANPVYLCLDHGGPWKKHTHHQLHSSHAECLHAVKDSIRACVIAGYSLLHLDATGTPPGSEPTDDTDSLVDLTLELQSFAESISTHPLHFEVGTREDGLGSEAVDLFASFVNTYSQECTRTNLSQPAFYVGDIGTTLKDAQADESRIDPMVAISSQHNALLKAHYSDDIINKSSFPKLGVGAANIGPGLSGIEHAAVRSLFKFDRDQPSIHPFDKAAIHAIRKHDASSLPEINAAAYPQNPNDVARVGYAVRYVWNDPDVAAARAELYARVSDRVDPGKIVNLQLEDYLKNYIDAFRLNEISGVH